MKAVAIEMGFGLSFTQTGRKVRKWDEKLQKLVRESLPDRRIVGLVTAVSSGETAVQIAVRDPNGENLTVHLPKSFDVGGVQQFRGPKTRWRCQKRCGAGEWTSESDVPQTCPTCGAGIEIEK